MPKEEHQLLPKYDFEFIGGKFNSYLFQTQHDIIYEITFKPSGYIFEEHHSFKEKTFEFSIIPIENPNKVNPPLDKSTKYYCKYFLRFLPTARQNRGLCLRNSR